MKHKKTIITLLSGVLLVTLVVGGIAYRSVMAATPSGTSTSISPSTQTNGAWMMGKGPEGKYTQEDLANALGITVDDLTAAYKTAYTAALNQAVSQGVITQAQADQLTTNGNAFPFGGRWEEYLTQNEFDFNTFLADALKISVDQLKAAYQTAYFTRIDQAVTDGNLTQEQADLLKGKYALYNDSTFQSSMQSAYKDAVSQAVASGVITQIQADQILSNSNTMFRFEMGGFGGHGGRGGPGGPRGDGFSGGFGSTAP